MMFNNVYHDDEKYNPVVLPIVTTTNYICELDQPRPKYSYSRDGNPNRNSLEKDLAILEDAEYALCFPSGMAAIMGIFVTLIKPGDHVICTNRVFVGTSMFLIRECERIKFEVTFVDMLNAQNLQSAIKPNTTLVFLEVLSNPSTRIINLKEISTILAPYPEVLLVVDNTLLTPCLMKPLHFGAHVIVHSATKLINGHGDVMMGVIATSQKRVYEPLKFYQCCMGIVPSPMDCYLVCRSLKTLHLRVREHCLGAKIVANFLDSHPGVESVLYPGLSNHPEHELAKRQMSDYGGLVSIYLKAGSEECHKFVKRLKLFNSSWGLGLADSIIFYSWTWFKDVPISRLPEGQNPPNEWTENFVRLWIGLEEPELLVLDLKRSLDKMKLNKT